MFIGRVHSPLDLTEEEWDASIKTNLKGSWLVSKYVCIRMRDAKLRGSVINVSSIAGLNRGQLPGGFAYVAGKAALNAITKVPCLFPFFLFFFAITYNNCCTSDLCCRY